MALVTCKMVQCPYHDSRGFCAQSTIVAIDENGMCSVLWRKGQQRMLRMPFSNDNYPKEPVVIIEAAEDQIHDVVKEKDEKEVKPVQQIS